MFSNGETVAIRFQRARLHEFALRRPHVADPIIRHREVALPVHIAGVAFGKAVSYCKALKVSFQSLIKIALGLKYVTEVVVGN